MLVVGAAMAAALLTACGGDDTPATDERPFSIEDSKLYLLRESRAKFVTLLTVEGAKSKVGRATLL